MHKSTASIEKFIYISMPTYSFSILGLPKLAQKLVVRLKIVAWTTIKNFNSLKCPSPVSDW